jgi:uncharacterized protein DUF4129
MPGKDARSGVDLRRPAAVLLLVAIAVIGLRAGVSLSSKNDPGLLVAGGHALYWIALAAAGLLVLLELVIVVVWLLWARKGGPSMPLPRRRRNPLWLIVLVVEIFALAKLIAILRQRAAAAAHAAANAARHGAGTVTGRHSFLPPASSWPLLVGLALAAVAASLLIMPIRRRARAFATPEPEPEPTPESQAPLLAALAAGAKPLQEDADPRSAIVRCYAAMEESLAGAGAPPSEADTPAEVLARASRGGLLRSAAANTLTGLFRQARYSTHPVTEADRAAAQHALGRLQADLGGAA